MQPRPYALMAGQLGCSEAQLLQTIDELLASGALSRFGPLYDAQKLGGGLTLAALTAPDADFYAIAAEVNALPQVAHNYRRRHALNMWFVIATERPDGVAAALQQIRQRTGLDVFDFPKQREFYLGLWLRLGEHGDIETIPAPETRRLRSSPPLTILDKLDRRLIALTQSGLPLHPEPFTVLANTISQEEQTDIGPQLVIDHLQRMLDSGAIRRIGAVPNHYRLGLRANGMSVWDLPGERLAELGPMIGALPWVSHCYERPRHRPQWRYNLFAMVHARGHDQVQRKVARIAELLGAERRGHQVLFSTAILKKTGLRLAA